MSVELFKCLHADLRVLNLSLKTNVYTIDKVTEHTTFNVSIIKYDHIGYMFQVDLHKIGDIFSKRKKKLRIKREKHLGKNKVKVER